MRVFASLFGAVFAALLLLLLLLLLLFGKYFIKINSQHICALSRWFKPKITWSGQKEPERRTRTQHTIRFCSKWLMLDYIQNR